MRANLRPTIAAFSLACLTALSVSALAQDKPPEAPKQMAITEKQVENAIATKPEIDAIMEKLPQGTEQPDAKTQAQLDAIAKKHGFATYAEFDDVTANISLALAGFDPQSKKYVGDEVVLKKELAQIQADKKMPPKDKKEALDQVNEALKSAAPLQFPANAQVVGKYYDKLSEEMPMSQQQ
jgi:hypothetical protein